MRISALLSVYNGVPYLAEAIDSMLAELGPEDEVIVVDDGSTDGTAAVLDRYAGRIVRLHNPNSGSAFSLNRARHLARGRYVAFNDADDLWEPGRIARQLAALEADAGLTMVGGLTQQFVSPELPDALREQLTPPSLEPMAGATMPNILVRAEVLAALGPFDETLRNTFGYSWLGEVRARGLRTAMLDSVVLRRRLHPANWTRQNKQTLQRDALRALHEQMIRRRSGPGT